jgi:lipopolysaccharide transport system ATP-binding protein
MSSNWAVTAEHVGKNYVIRRSSDEPYLTVRDVLAERAARAARRVIHPWSAQRHGGSRREREDFWALRDMSFTIEQGERVGIIGRNGAGKSTLLKVLSRITEPTTGRLGIRGRVASLLEVGTGFHPELTGRENIYLNGAVLGMKRTEIKAKFDEIVAFAEVERFLDTPVKRYSSGMYVRLAFAVAAHLEPEILIVDEVLAVGDAAFQKKCLGKMESVGQDGRTVLFVSHNMDAITRLCTRGILLESGSIIIDGPASDVAATYLHKGQGSVGERTWGDGVRAPGNATVRLRSVRLRTEDGAATASIDIRVPLGIEMEYEVLEAGQVLVPSLHLHNDQGVCVFVAHDFGSEWRRKPRPVGSFKSTMWIPGNFLAEGGFTVSVGMGTYQPVIVHFDVRDVLGFVVVDSLDGDSARGDFAGRLPGVIRPIFNWDTERVGDAAFVGSSFDASPSR